MAKSDKVLAHATDTQRGASAATGVYGGSGTAASPTKSTGTGSTAPPPTPTTGMGTGTGIYTSTTKTPVNSPAGDIRPGTAGTTTGGPGTDQASSKTSKTGTGVS